VKATVPRAVRKCLTNALLRCNLPYVLERLPLALADRQKKARILSSDPPDRPHCGNQFEIEGVKLVIFDAGAESFPITAIVDESCLVPRKSKRPTAHPRVAALPSDGPSPGLHLAPCRNPRFPFEHGILDSAAVGLFKRGLPCAAPFAIRSFPTGCCH
jgi:hypothetical protein